MLLALKEDNTADSFCLCCLLHAQSVIITSGVIFTNLHLYNYVYRLCGSIYVSLYTIGLHVWSLQYVDISKLQKNILFSMFHNITPSLFL